MPLPDLTARSTFAVLLLAAATGCAGPDEGRSAAEDGSEAPGAAEQPHVPDAELGEIAREDLGLALPWTTGRISRDPPEEGGPSPLRRLAVSRLETFDRLVFEVDSADPFPGYTVDATLGSVPGCTDGDSATARGEGFLRIRLLNASASPEVAGDAERTSSELANVETVSRCDREDDTVEWLLDVRDAAPYRVLQASNPPRVAVDLMHEPAGTPAAPER